MHLRLITYLAPSLPLRLYEGLCRLLSSRLGVSTSLVSETRRSGPEDRDNPFSRDEVDVGFMCAPCFLNLRSLDPAPVELVQAAPVYEDPRCQGRPVYFSDVVMRSSAPARTFAELRGARWAYNDPQSLSGYHSVLNQVAALGLGDEFLGEAMHAGSHLAALAAVVAGAVEFAAIDSNSLALERRTRPDLVAGLRVLTALGPHPVQPVVARRALPTELKDRLAAVLLTAHDDPTTAEDFEACGLVRFVSVPVGHYSRRAVFGARA